MARINQLVNSATLNATDVLAKDAASGGTTNKITAQDLTNGVKTLGSLVNTTEMNAAIAQSTAIKTGTETLTTNANGVVALTNIKPKTHVLIALYVGNGAYGYMRTDSINSDVFGIQVLNMTSGQSPTKVASTTLTFTYTYLDFST